MYKIYGLLVLALLFSFQVKAQIQDGSTAPDFTFTDIKGNTQNLYTWLNQGKYVVIDVSATWCGPCWNFHESKILDSLYERHDNPGDQKWKVLFIEGDKNTDSADLYGNTSASQGNWVQGSNYIIIDPPAGNALNDFFNGYSLAFYPTFFLICPDKKVYQDTLNGFGNPGIGLWEYVANSVCLPAGIDNLNDKNPVTVYPNPATDFTTLYFRINGPSGVILHVTNILAQVIDAKDFGILLPGDQSIRYETCNLQPGVYFFTISLDARRVIRKKVIIQ